jgi:hypothetical protein
MEENQMQSTNEWKEWRRFFSTKEDASAATRRDRIRATRKAAMEAAGSRVFALLVLACVGYFVFGGTFEASSPFEPESSIAAAAVKSEDSGNAPRDEHFLSLFATPAETIFLPPSHVKLR